MSEHEARAALERQLAEALRKVSTLRVILRRRP